MSDRQISQTAKTLIEAKKLIEDERNWCQWSQGEDKRGGYVDPWAGNCVKRCAYGAISAMRGAYPNYDTDPAIKALEAAKPEGFATAATYNNDTSHENVLAMFDLAISAELEKGRNND